MKKKIISAASALIILFTANAQMPAGFEKGSVTLADGTTLSGFVKDNMKRDASVVYTDANGSNKTAYSASIINAAGINGTDYRSIKGDFFKVICNGKICFLQKASNATGKTIYNGSEAIIVDGTPGKTGDYFSYSNNELVLINKKSVDAFIGQMSSCNEALEKAKAINGNIAALADAVAIYNSLSK